MPKAAGAASHVEKGHIIVHTLVALFGVSAWIGINGIFIQLPVLINVSPEGWNLPAYVVLVIQAANVGPLLYMLALHLRYKVNEPLCILCLLAAGTLAMGLLIFFYSEKTVIAGTEHSLALFILIFFNALVGCFSSVLFMPYLHDFKKIYLISYFIGEGLSGVLPSVVALTQGIGDDSDCGGSANSTLESASAGLTFPPTDYFLFIFIVLLLSLVAYAVLEYSPFVRNARNLHNAGNPVRNGAKINRTSPNEPDITSDQIYSDNAEKNGGDSLTQRNINHLSKRMRWYLFCLLGVCCFFSNGFFPSVQSYSCLPYGNTAYKLSVTFSQFANPLACFLALWFMGSGIRVTNFLSLVCLIIGSYVTTLALMSPTPPWRETTHGVILVVAAWTALMGFISYLKLMIVSALRSIATPKILFKVGAVMQAGSATGAIVSFVLMNFSNSFQMYDRCSVAKE